MPLAAASAAATPAAARAIHASAGASHAANGGMINSASTLPSSRSSSKSFRDGWSAMLARDGTYSNHDDASSPSENAANACRIRAESGAFE